MTSTTIAGADIAVIRWKINHMAGATGTENLAVIHHKHRGPLRRCGLMAGVA